MAYPDQWKFGDFEPSWKVRADWKSFPTITLSCAAENDEDNIAMWEIHQIMKMACSSINRKPLLNGGECVNTSPDCSKMTITNGFYSFTGAVGYPQFEEDSSSGDVIEFDIIIEAMAQTLVALGTDPFEEEEP